MIDTNRDSERDAILFALHETCTNPTAEQIDEWVKRYPKYADDIRSHAAIMKDWAAREDLPAQAPDEAMISRSQSRLMDALYKARAAEAGGRSTARTFEQIMTATGTDVPGLARKLDIKRSILSALVGGRMLAPVGDRLVSALTDCWAITTQVFDAALQIAINAPSLGIPKAGGNPTVIPRSYEDLVRSSSMTVARKKYWLGEE